MIQSQFTLAAAEDVRELVADLRATARGLESQAYPHTAALITRAAYLLEQRHPTPVPVSERLPGPEDCDAEERCWLHLPDMGTEPLWRLTDPALRARYHTHWLSFTALPLPEGEVKE